MSVTILPRKLWYLNLYERVFVDQSFLQTDPRPLVVLGEAGMGKSTLLEQLRTVPGYAFCTARKLINSPDPGKLLGGEETLVVDALDEVSVQRDGDAVDTVIRQLAALDNPRFILSCRVADWRSATALQGIKDFYDREPLELYLEPLDRADALAVLSETLGIVRAEQTLNHLEALGLPGLWGNPQTLELVERVAGADKLPESKGELFERATRLLSVEHREVKAEGRLASLPEDDVLDATGAAFATLILTGKDALSRLVKPDNDDLPIREITTLPRAPYAASILDSRLFAARGVDRFTYAHRAIGEFLGARWLARMADTPRKQRRLLAMFSNQALVPVNLRGLHAWIAWHSHLLAEDVITADPMGIIIYGDADRLGPTQGHALLSALQKLSIDNPRFRDWTEYRVGGLVQPALLTEIRNVLENGCAEFGLRLLMLQGLKNSPLVNFLEEVLTTLVLDKSSIFALRSEAGDRLVQSAGTHDWPHLIRTLLRQREEDGIRLAFEMMSDVGFEHFEDSLVLDVTIAQFERSEQTIGVFLSLERKLPTGMLETLIEGVAAAAVTMGNSHERPHDSAVTDLMFALLARRLEWGNVDPSKLWSWLRPFDSQTGYQRETRKIVAEFLAKDSALRRGVQRLVLLDQEGGDTVWHRLWRLNERSHGLRPIEADVIDLLDRLKIGDGRWREVVLLVPHSEEQGLAVREAATRLAGTDLDDIAWLRKIAVPEVPNWQIEEDQRQRERKEKRVRDWERHRVEFTTTIEALRAGEYGAVIRPAQAYLKLFSDFGEGPTDGPHRIEEWLGPELRDASLAGFEAFLIAEPPRPTASEIANSHAEGRRWEAGYIIVVALAERLRRGWGFNGLSDERVTAGFLEVFQSKIDDHAGIEGLDAALEAALRERGAWEAAIRLHFEPQFVQRRENINGLYRIMSEPRDAELIDGLAMEWLDRFPEMGGVPETELIDRLIGSVEGRVALCRTARSRRAIGTLNDERRRNWDAVGLILAFDQTRSALEAAGTIEKQLFWHIRARLGDRRNQVPRRRDVLQLAWMIATFRLQFPLVHRPQGGTSGDTNPWDASEYMYVLISRLGDQISEEAIVALIALRDGPTDGYTDFLRIAAAEQKRKRVEAQWVAPSFATIKAALSDAPPTTSTQLQVVVLEELREVQAMLRGSDLDYYKGFFEGSTPRVEDECRDTLLKMLRGSLPFGILAQPEQHLADDKRCDISCLLGELMVPIEIKGQWHPELWTAADRQLDLLYVNDWRADRGIYLVLWFGRDANKPLAPTPPGVKVPNSADELKLALAERGVTTREGRNEVVVIDLTRPV